MYAMHAVGDERTAGLAQDECGQALQVRCNRLQLHCSNAHCIL
jgi:hypothetical protein